MPLVEPAATGYGWWPALLVAPVLYSAWASPFELAVQRAATLPLLVADLVADVFFAADIVASISVACLQLRGSSSATTGLFYDDRKKATVRHLRPWTLAMDVASTIPFQAMYHLLATGSRGAAWSSPCRFLSLLRMWRLRRVSELFASLEKDVRLNYFWTRLVKLVGVMLNIPQPFTVRCRRLTQVVRVSQGQLLRVLRPHTADADSVFCNFVQHLGSPMWKVAREEAPLFREIADQLEAGAAAATAASVSRQRSEMFFFNPEGLEEAERRMPLRSGSREAMRVVIHHRSATAAGKLICLPGSMNELARVAEAKFGKVVTTVLTVDGAEVEDIDVLRDGDHLFLC